MTDNRRLLIAFAVLLLIAGAIVIYSMSAGAQSPPDDARVAPPPAERSICENTPSMPENPSYDLLLDCDTLIAIKSTLEGDTGALNWETETSIGMWDGIRTGGSPPRVTSIKLQREDLSGFIPAELGSLDALEDIWFYSNSLTGPIPPTIGNLSNLRTLMLAWNDLSGELPAELNKLDLDRLWLRGNSFTGCVPYNLSLVPDNDLDRVGPPICETVPPPTDEERILAIVEKANCTADDLDYVLTLPGSFRLIDHLGSDSGLYEHTNSKGLWAYAYSYWEHSYEYIMVQCYIHAFDNVTTAALEVNYDGLRYTDRDLDYDVILESKIASETLTEIGDEFIVMYSFFGRTDGGTPTSVDFTESGSMYRRGQIAATILISGNVSYRPYILESISRSIDARIADDLAAIPGGLSRSSRSPAAPSQHLEPFQPARAIQQQLQEIINNSD